MRNLIISPAVITRRGFDIGGALAENAREGRVNGQFGTRRHAKLRLILGGKFELSAKFEGVRILEDIGRVSWTEWAFNGAGFEGSG